MYACSVYEMYFSYNLLYVATVICFSESSLFIAEDLGTVTIALTLTTPSSMDNFTVMIIPTDITATGKYLLIIVCTTQYVTVRVKTSSLVHTFNFATSMLYNFCEKDIRRQA